MAPKKATTNAPKKVSREKKVMDLATKLKIIELLEDNERYAIIARKFEVNESTIRSIRDNKAKIKESSSKLGAHAKFCKISRQGNFLSAYIYRL